MDDSEASRVRALGDILREFDLDMIRVKLGDHEYELVLREPQAVAPLAPQQAIFAASQGVAPSAVAVPQAGAAPPFSDHASKVLAPVVGVFYRSANPNADPFVSVGDRVTVGQTLCILEAMKLMNEITSDFAGVVTRIVPENGELVRLNEELFWIEP